MRQYFIQDPQDIRTICLASSTKLEEESMHQPLPQHQHSPVFKSKICPHTVRGGSVDYDLQKETKQSPRVYH